MTVRGRRMNEVHLPRHALRLRSLLILPLLPVSELAWRTSDLAAKGVGNMAMEAEDFRFLWEDAPRDLEALELDQFKAHWKLDCVVGRPRSSHALSRMNSSGLSQFALSHTVQRWDTLDSLVLKYDVQVSPILLPRFPSLSNFQLPSSLGRQFDER